MASKLAIRSSRLVAKPGMFFTTRLCRPICSAKRLGASERLVTGLCPDDNFDELYGPNRVEKVEAEKPIGVGRRPSLSSIYGQRACVAGDDRWLALREILRSTSSFKSRSFWHCLNCEVDPEARDRPRRRRGECARARPWQPSLSSRPRAMPFSAAFAQRAPCIDVSWCDHWARRRRHGSRLAPRRRRYRCPWCRHQLPQCCSGPWSDFQAARVRCSAAAFFISGGPSWRSFLSKGARPFCSRQSLANDRVNKGPLFVPNFDP